MIERRSLYINNQWQKGLGTLIESYNPATGKLLWQGFSASDEDVVKAVESARAAFSYWKDLSLEERCCFLTAFASKLEQNHLKLATIISEEVGKPLWESKTEVSAMIQKIDISIEAHKSRCKTTVRELTRGSSITRHRPHGVVAIFGPFNFPGHLPNGHIIPSLLAGNTIVFKPSEQAPLVAEEIMRYWEESNLPPGVLNQIQGGQETGKLLAKNKDIDGLFFTGSYKTGKELSLLFGNHPEKILALEMGGNNPLVVDTVSDLLAAAHLIIQSAFLTSGQRCTCARRLIINDAIADDLIDILKGRVEKIIVGPYTLSPEPFMGPVISKKSAEDLLDKQKILVEKGAIAIRPMGLLAKDSGLITPGLLDVTKINERKDEEIFGPLLQIIRVKSFSDAIDEANKTNFGLSAGLLSDSRDNFDLFLRSIRAGIVNWNTPLTGASSFAPFGGIKQSGNHRPSAYYAADYCSYPVASIEVPSLKVPEVLLPGLT